MADVFVSYARTDKARVAPLVAALEAKGWSVWWDPAISPGKEFDDEIDGELQAAKAVLVVWTPTSVVSRWVRGEARDAAERGILVPVRFDQARLPIDVRALHTTDLDDWRENPSHSALQECLRALEAMIVRSQAAQPVKTTSTSAETPSTKDSARFSICVLPFNNMSGDAEQDYFSDGITEDIITDLSKVSALAVTSSNTAFRYKGQHADIPKVVRELKVSHVLEGSVRKAGGRVRINAQLIDGASDNHVWAERYDRDASDIFAIQDEISQAIVKALKLRLLPEEKKAIERRGTDSADAHDLYLMARQLYVTNQEDEQASKAIVRTCARATEIDPRYVQAWALMAAGYRSLRELGLESDDGMTAAEKALALDPKLAEAHAVKGYILQMRGDMDGAVAEAAAALKLNSESYEANRTAARLNYLQHRFEDAVRLYQKAVNLMETDVNSAMMLVSSYRALGDVAGMRGAAEIALKRADAFLSHDQSNAGVIAYSANALGALGEGDRAKARMNRAMLIDPDNWNMRYNFACALSVYLKDTDATLKMVKSLLETATEPLLDYMKADPDFDHLHDDPRWQSMVAAAEARLAATKKPATAAGKHAETKG
ncbi:MAG: TIR domain-containing protein [Gammaproteobacteria bacterium]|nr:TIR domain-containing protein [Gammaproteobacteria bacterium]